MVLPAPDSLAAPAAAAAPVSAGMMARVGRRFLTSFQARDSLNSLDKRVVIDLPGSARRMSLKLQAGMAEFLLVNRLRARARPVLPTQSEQVLARGAQIVQVTCKHWFSLPGAHSKTRAASPEYRTRL